MFTCHRFYRLSCDVHELYYDNRWFIVQLTCSLTTCTCTIQPNNSCFIVDSYRRRPRRARIVTCQQLFHCWHIADCSSSSYTCCDTTTAVQLLTYTHIPQPCPNCRAGVRLSHLWEALQFCSAITRHCLEIRVTLVPNLYSYASLRPSSQRTPYRARACPWEYHTQKLSCSIHTTNFVRRQFFPRLQSIWSVFVEQ